MAGLLAAVLVLLSIRDVGVRAIPSDIGPYLRYMDRMGNCDGVAGQQGKIAIRCSHFNPHKPFEPQRCRGNVTLVEDLDDTYWFSGILDRRSNNQWKENYHVQNISDDPTIRAFMRSSDSCIKFGYMFFQVRHEDYGTCTVKKGTYEVNMLSNTRPAQGQIGTFAYGFYRERYIFGRGSRTLLCFWTEAHYIQRPGLR